MSPSKETKAAVLESLQELTASQKQIPTMSEFVDETDWGYKHIEQSFSSWKEAIEAAGIDYKASLATELQNVANQVGHRPTPEEMNEVGRYSSGMYEWVFESWEEAISTADLTQPEETEQSTNPGTEQPAQDDTDSTVPVEVTDEDSGILASIEDEFESTDSD